MDLLDVILEIDPSFKGLMQTRQYACSKIILQAQMQGHHTPSQMARLLDVDEEWYARMTTCDLSVPLDVYEAMAKRVQEGWR